MEQKKYKVIAYRADTGGCEKARLRDPIKYLKKNYQNIFEIEIKSSINRQDYLLLEDESNPLSKVINKKVDLLVFQRTTDIRILDFIEDAKKFGVKTIYEVDDSFDTIPPTSTAYNFYIRTKGTLSNIHKLMRACDAITVSTLSLKETYKADYVLPNSIDFDDFNTVIKKNNKEKIIIGWMGSSTHLEDLKQISSAITQVVNMYENVYLALGGWSLKKVIKEEENPRGCFSVEAVYKDKKYPLIKDYESLKPLYNKYIKKEKDKYTLLNMQVTNEELRKEFPEIDLDEFIMIRKRSELKGIQYCELDERHLFENIKEDKIIDLPWVSNADELAKVFSIFDIGIAPLHDNEFNNFKSNIKFLQYSSLAIPTIASRVGPYQEIEDKQVGITIKSKGAQHEKWVKALELLIKNKEYRIDLGKKAYNYVKENYDMDKNCALWAAAWKNIIEK